ncbi:MAG TPA: phosphate acyltransferase [Oscillospiraceae bacterium]|nr:phosphate acyltransferase [Oscillospiraceae bacterium]
MKSCIETLEEKAKSNPQRVIFPEGGDTGILTAASMIVSRGVAYPILIGDPDEIRTAAKQGGISLDGIELRRPASEETISVWAEKYAADGGELSAKAISRRLTKPLYQGAAAVQYGKADAMVAGISCTTGDVIIASQIMIGTAPGIKTPSSFFLMEIPGYKSAEGNLIIFADCGVCPEPTPDELADIAIATADSAKNLLGWEPRVAMLSFSTKGSSEHEAVDNVLAGLEIIRKREPQLAVDGELQLDAAIIPSVARRKVPGESSVAGRANILIFPDLNAGNITYKAVQRFAWANAYGPFLQGFAKPVSDLSRGATPEDIVGVTIMSVVRAQNN